MHTNTQPLTNNNHIPPPPSPTMDGVHRAERLFDTQMADKSLILDFTMNDSFEILNMARNQFKNQ